MRTCDNCNKHYQSPEWENVRLNSSPARWYQLVQSWRDPNGNEVLMLCRDYCEPCGDALQQKRETADTQRLDAPPIPADDTEPKGRINERWEIFRR